MSSTMMMLDNRPIYYNIRDEFVTEDVKETIRKTIESVKSGNIPQGVIMKGTWIYIRIGEDEFRVSLDDEEY